jgi:hypothetical protein
VDDRHKLIYCSIGKSGSTTFASYLWHLNVPNAGNDRAHNTAEFRNRTGIRFMRELSTTERKRVIKEYFKFLVVRHPFDRLVSAWENLLSKPNLSHVITGSVQNVINQYVKQVNSSRKQDFDQTKETLTFQQFLQLISDKRTNSDFTNVHWASYAYNCQPCHVHYDHVFRLETLPRDINTLYNYLRGVNGSREIPIIAHANNNRKIEPSTKLKAISKVYKNISQTIKQGLQSVYSRDMTLFGYKWENDEASCSWEDLNCC